MSTSQPLSTPESGRTVEYRYPPRDGLEGCYAAGFDRCQDVRTTGDDSAWEIRCHACGAFYGAGATPKNAEPSEDEA